MGFEPFAHPKRMNTVRGGFVRIVAPALLMALALIACRSRAGSDPLTFEYDFALHDAGFGAGYAGLPADADVDDYELFGFVQPLPAGMTGGGYLLKASNESGELLLYLKREISGLEPDTDYEASFEIDLVTSIPEGISTPIGSPGEDVFVKAGATLVEPVEVTDDEGWTRLNLDVGEPGEGGADALLLGNVAYEVADPQDDGSWQVKTLTSEGQRFTVTSDDEGNLWLLAAIHSDFEGLSALYVRRIALSLTR